MTATSQEYTSELLHIACQGAAQGQGFRPKIAREADALAIPGCVFNDLAGVSLLVKASRDQKQRLLDQLARLFDESVTIHVSDYQPELVALIADAFQQALATQAFVIVQSVAHQQGFYIPKDIGICEQCEQELQASNSGRRYQHVLNACAECGPRYSLIGSLPFDRENTALDKFPMCPQCQKEYQDRADRRFHSQLNHCKNCGPQYWLQNSSGEKDHCSGEALIAKICEVLLQGGIVAIKNMGGFHLCCLAKNEESVARLRTVKQRPKKPLAVMATLSQAKNMAHIDQASERCLQSNARPIVILPYKHQSTRQEMSGIAPGLKRVGVMLPNTALHVLLLEKLGEPVVMTSANLSGGALASDYRELTALSSAIDLFVLSDRDIYNPADDAVYTASDLGLQLVRHGRGVAPSVIKLTQSPKEIAHQKQILAMGAELKNSFAMLRHDTVFLSSFIGDLHDADVLQRFHNQCEKELQRFQFKPDVIAVDAHPDYHSSQWGRELANEAQAELIQVQHHHAHGVACMVEHGLSRHEPIYTWVLDGFGWGDDNTLWGGELLQITAAEYCRLGSIKPFSIVGGGLSAKQPWRNALSLIQGLSPNVRSSLIENIRRVNIADALVDGALKCLHQQVNVVPTSSAGRLFDGVAALLGFPDKEISYEGEAALWLQQKAENYLQLVGGSIDQSTVVDQYLQIEESGQQIQINGNLWLASLLEVDSSDARQIEQKAYQFHVWLAQSMTACLLRARELQGDSALSKKVLLCGGVMQNQLLLALLHHALSAIGFQVFWPQNMPANDGGIALGQAVVAAAQLESTTHN